MRGRGLQERRKRLWLLLGQRCAECGRLVVLEYPHQNGFELDHKILVSVGGPDTDDNCQILCSGEDGCHAKKTKLDLGYGVVILYGNTVVV